LDLRDFFGERQRKWWPKNEEAVVDPSGESALAKKRGEKRGRRRRKRNV